MRYPLNTIIPLFILVMGLTASGLLALLSGRTLLSEQRRDAERLTSMTGSAVAAALSDALRYGSLHDAQRALDRLKFDRTLALAIYIDDANAILLSTDHGRDAARWEDTSFSQAADEVLRARETSRGQYLISRDLQDAFGVFPVLLPPGENELATTRTGLLLVHRDITRERAHLVQQVLRLFAALALVVLTMSIALWVFLRVALLGRIKALMRALEDSGPADGSGPLPASGRDEVARLARSFDRLNDRVRNQTAALRASERRFRSTFEQAAVGIAHVSLDGRWIRVNQRLCAITGYGEAKLLARTYRDVAHPDDVARCAADLEALASGSATTATSEVRYLRPSGEPIWASSTASAVRDDAGSPEYFVVVIEEITGRKRAEEERERFLMAMEQSRDMIEILDMNKRIIYVNAAFEATTGFRREEVIGARPNRFDTGSQGTRVLRRIERRLAAGRTWAGLVHSRCRDGTEIVEHMSIAPVFDDRGECTNYVVVSRDVTAALAQEQKSRDLEEQHRQTQKLESLGTLAGGIAHDFNNILAIISGHCEMAASALPESNPVQEDLLTIRNTVTRAATLVSKILLFSRRAGENREELRLADVLDDALDLLRAAVPSTITLIRIFDDREISVRADPTQLYQVMMNLVTNACHAIGAGPGMIRVSVAQCVREGEPARYARIVVEDSGSGMDNETKARIFEPFYTTKGTGEGTGLGLSTVHGIVTAHGGDITVSSAPGAGTRFEITLPALSGGGASRTDSAVRELPSGGGEHVVVVDDEPSIVSLNKRLLERAGYRVTGFVDSELALQHLLSRHAEAHLVIADFTMPKMTGYDLARRLREAGSEIPIIIMTGYADSLDPDALESLRFAQVLGKPVAREGLLSAIRNAINHSRAGGNPAQVDLMRDQVPGSPHSRR